MNVVYPDKETTAQFFKNLSLWSGPLLLFFVLLWLANGFYIVGPGEVGVVRRLGKEIRKTEPGLRYHIPRPFERADVVNLEQVRRAEIGFRSYQGEGRQRVGEEALMLTGDENIVEAQIIIQYQISDPSAYLFNVERPEEVLHTSTEVALRSMIGSMAIDTILTTGREKLQIDTRDFLQRLLNHYKTGLRVSEVRLQVVDPPEQVKDAFHEVVRAREDRERLINQAQGYREDVIPKARGRAEQMIREAEAHKEERVLRAQGDATRFLALQAEYKKAPGVTRTRLYLESLEGVFKDMRKTLIDPDAAKSVSGILPLGELRLDGAAPARAGKDA